MQVHYEHCIPKKEEDPIAKRTVVVFRHGKQNDVMFDTGNSVLENDHQADLQMDATFSSAVKFGHPSSDIIEGKEVYTKETLIQSGAHHFERRWVSGTMRDGCDSVLVERQDLLLREDDGLCWLQITSARNEGGASLYQSFVNKTPIRVFRSSELDSRYAPDVYQDEIGQVLYRYDGLYAVKAIWDSDGDETDEAPPADGSQYTFLLTRYPKLPADESTEPEMIYNHMSVQELWNEIQKRRQILKPRPFQLSHPITSLAPVGDKSNLTRRRKDIIELPSESNSKLRKKRRKNHVNNDESEETRIITENEIESTQADGNSLSSEQLGKKPKRASAAAARSYLQEAMQNKFGSQDKEKKPIDGTAGSKRSTINKSSQESVSSNDHPPSDKETKFVSVLKGMQSNFADTEESISISSVQASDRKPAKRTYTRRNVVAKKGIKRSRSNQDSIEELPTKRMLAIDPGAVEVGHRIHVDYKNILYKATVRKVRAKNNVLDFLVHYDGNKKSNVRWITAEMINEVLPETEAVDDVKTKGSVIQKRITTTNMDHTQDDESVQDQDTIESNKQNEQGDTTFAHHKGDMVYVDYKNVLYLASIQRSKLNRKGVQEYLVHYDGFKKTSDRWVTADSLFDINEKSTERYNKQRGEETVVSTADKLTSSAVSKRKNHLLEGHNEKNSISSSLDMGNNEPGVDFLPGSCVFVARDNALYLAKMLKRRGRAPDMDYLVHYDGSSDNYDSWVPVHLIYEINPRTRRIYESTSDKRDPLNDGDEDDESESDEESDAEGEKAVDKSPGKRTSRSKKASTKYSESEDYKKVRRTSPKMSDTNQKMSTAQKKAESDRGKNNIQKVPKLLDMTGIEAGVEFLPGSTVFIVWKNALYLGKMLKKRGKGVDMEYFVHYDGFRKSSDAWVSASMIYEINPQTKRAFNKQNKQK